MAETPATGITKTLANDERVAAKPATVDTGESAIEGKPKKKRKKKYSRGLRDIQRIGEAASRATERISRAVEVGLKSYRRRTNKSAGKRRDGALRDAFENAAVAAGKAIRVSARAPRDLAKGLDTKAMWRGARPLVRLAATPLFRR